MSKLYIKFKLMNKEQYNKTKIEYIAKLAMYSKNIIIKAIHSKEKYKYIPIEIIEDSYIKELTKCLINKDKYNDFEHFMKVLLIKTYDSLKRYIRAENTQKRNKYITVPIGILEFDKFNSEFSFKDIEFDLFLKQELTTEEYSIIKLALDGYSYQEIKKILHISQQKIPRAFTKIKEKIEEIN